MSQASVNKNLFVSETKTHNDQGIMNIGKHCHKCQQLDFLPFHCEYCNFTYCSSHRNLESHRCPGKPREEARSNQQYDGPTAASLFPDREKDKIKLENSINNAKPKATNIIGRNSTQGNVLTKFAKFLKLQKNKKKNDNKVMGLFKRSAPRARSKVAEMAILRRDTRGDPKVSETDKIYMWCLYINPKQVSDNAETDIFANINVENEKKAVWVSKQWSVGRALDSIADKFNIVNINNQTRETDERLCICKVNNDGLSVMVETADRCLKAFKNADLIYLVRGSI